MVKYKVLCTKKLKPALVEEVRQHNIEIVEQEFIAIQPIWSEEKLREIDRWATAGIAHIVVTSANTADILNQYLCRDSAFSKTCWKIFCIAGKTKEHLLQHFCPENIIATADYGKDLAGKIMESGVKEVVFFCGNKRRDELPHILRQNGVAVHEVVVYETIETPAAIANDIDGVIFFSPSAVQSFFAANQLSAQTVCFAIGTTTADAITHYTNNKVIISQQPSQESIITTLTKYFTNKVNH